MSSTPGGARHSLQACTIGEEVHAVRQLPAVLNPSLSRTTEALLVVGPLATAVEETQGAGHACAVEVFGLEMQGLEAKVIEEGVQLSDGLTPLAETGIGSQHELLPCR